MDKPSFQSFNEAETVIRDQILDLCELYSTTIRQTLPMLERATKEPKLSYDEKSKFLELLKEGKDHVHNLVQLKIELNDLKELNQSILLEISSEVLANTVKYLELLPKSIEEEKSNN